MNHFVQLQHYNDDMSVIIYCTRGRAACAVLKVGWSECPWGISLLQQWFQTIQASRKNLSRLLFCALSSLHEIILLFLLFVYPLVGVRFNQFNEQSARRCIK